MVYLTTRMPAHTTSLGKALLAERSDGEVRELLPAALSGLTRTPSSTTPRWPGTWRILR